MNQLSAYLHQIEAAFAAGNATEHTHRPALKTLLESLETGLVATNEPKRIHCGAPDFILTRGQTPLGYVEAKDVGKLLDAIESDEQLKRYRESLANLILTDYLEFRWYVGGQPRLTARLASIVGKSLRPEAEGEVRVAELLDAFLHSDAPILSRPKELAERMAQLARLLCNLIERALADEDRSGSLHQQREGFRHALLHDLTVAQFADMYAQTIGYGLFAARCNVPDGKPFTRQHAAYDLPKTNPFLRRMFDHIAGIDLDERIAWAVDDLADLLRRADMATILADFGRRTRQEDPVVHFYETFLAAYNPKLREARGVYYTPEPVVSYLVRSVDTLLKKEFKLPQGLADHSKVILPARNGKPKTEVHKVQILDPATGTGTFLYSVIDKIYESFTSNQGMWSGYVHEHLLPRLVGFELLMAPYTVAHMKLGLQLAETGYDFASKERLHIYLTNTLEEADEYAGMNLFAQWLTDEANAAGMVKQETPVMVVLGNPPYSGQSMNKGQWIANLLHGQDTRTGKPTGNYFAVEGQPLGERNPKWLNDDYVKFIRFAQWRIEQTGYGVLAFVTNHGYLDNPTFRGMRQSLMETFDQIYVLDLHGNSKKKERAPDGGKDENVFDIQQGVTLGIFVKKSGTEKRTATVRHAQLWGSRESKYRSLLQSDVESTDWKELNPSAPRYLFIPQNADLGVEYERGYKITDFMQVNGWGIATRKDYLLVDFSRDVVVSRFKDIRSLSVADAIAKYKIKESPHWDFATAKKQMSVDIEAHTRPVLFRPFDIRFLHYEKCMIERGDHRFGLMWHLLKENLCFISVRRTEGTEPSRHFYCTNQFSVLHSTSAKEGNFIFPLYIYPNGVPKSNLFDEDAPGGRWPNLAPEFVADFAARLGMTFVPEGKGDRTQTFGPEDVFAYMYAVFHSPTYRSRYAEFLKIDFPRLPLTANADLFRALCALGEELVGLHLMETTGPNLSDFPERGDNRIDNVRYSEPTPTGDRGRVWINTTQYFDSVAPEVWAFQVGGYQVCQKWLKDRKGRTLSHDDLNHYRGICAALSETIRIMAAIDTLIQQHGGWSQLTGS